MESSSTLCCFERRVSVNAAADQFLRALGLLVEISDVFLAALPHGRDRNA
jgi:hypothetical protein